MTTAKGIRVLFPARVWEADVERRYRSGSRPRRVAEQARRELERDGIDQQSLLACDPEHPGGTRLEDCLKVYLPLGPAAARERPFGMVFRDIGRYDPVLLMVAYGVRHQPARSHAPTVYELAHRRLHPDG